MLDIKVLALILLFYVTYHVQWAVFEKIDKVLI